MAGNVSIQAQGGGTTYGVIPVSGAGVSFLNPLYKYANLTLPYSPNDPGLQYQFFNQTLAPNILIYARFFNLLNEPSSGVLVNVGTSAFSISVSGAQSCLDVRDFGAKGDGVTDDTAAIQAALDKAYQNYLGNVASTGLSTAVPAMVVQSNTGHIENGSGSILTIQLPLTTTLNNKLFVAFCAFDYGGGPNSPATPAVTDDAGNTYSQLYHSQNGEFNLYLYGANVATTGKTTVTITMTQKQYNSFISAIYSEFSGVPSIVSNDGSNATLINQASSFQTAQLGPSTQNDVVFTIAVNSLAAGQTPSTPTGFTLVGAQINPQPNGLNSAVPVTVMAYGPWTGVAPIAPKWGGTSWSGTTFTIAFRVATVAIPPTKGFTTVCIPAGVNCMVSPVALDERNFPSTSCRYGAAAYSLLINDGVTLEIDGSLIANPAASAAMVNSSESVGWFLVMNKNWLNNSTIFTPYKQTPGFYKQIDNSGMASAGTQGIFATESISFPVTGSDFVFYVSQPGNTTVSPFPDVPAGFSFTLGQGSPGAGILAQRVTTGPETTTAGETYKASSNACSCAGMVAFKILPGYTPAFSSIASGSSNIGTTISSNVAIPDGSILLAIWKCSSVLYEDPIGLSTPATITDDQGNEWVMLLLRTNNGKDGGSNLWGCGVSIWACFNPKPVSNGTVVNYTWTVHQTSGSGANDGGGNLQIALLTGIGACGSSVGWSNYLAGTAINEGTRNKNLKITGNGAVILNGDNQVNQTSSTLSTPAVVQSANTGYAGAISNPLNYINLPFSSPCAAGSAVLVSINLSTINVDTDSMISGLGVTDSQGNSYSFIGKSPKSHVSSFYNQMALYMATGVKAGANTVIVSNSFGSVVNWTVNASEVSGVAGSRGFVGNSINSYTQNTDFLSGPVTTVGGDLVFSCLALNGETGDTFTVDNGYTIKSSYDDNINAVQLLTATVTASSTTSQVNWKDTNDGGNCTIQSLMVSLKQSIATGGQLYPVGLARFVATDSSTIDSVQIINPFGCAIQWLNSDSSLISGLFIHNGATSQPLSGPTDPGIIEIDMMRNSSVRNSLIQNCELSRGILDWASYQSTITGNTLDGLYTGYEYRDADGEWGIFFTNSVVTQNSTITGNRAVNCTFAPASTSAAYPGATLGSNGFLFLGGYVSQFPVSTVTGIIFQNNTASGNNTDFSYDSYVSFLALGNNTFGGGGGGGVQNGQNPVTGETPTGLVNGTNVTFTLAHIPIVSTVTVFLNGLYQSYTADYSVSGNQIIFVVPPNTGSAIVVNYSYLSGN